MAVYAGFDFRRMFVREALSGDLDEELLMRAVPLSQLPSVAGHGVEAFKMKPSFAYVEHVQERLTGLAYHEAETDLSTEAAAALHYASATNGGATSICPANEAREPCYRRVEAVSFALESARLHTHGVLMLPLYAVEYTLLGQRFRAFVSALRPGPSPTVAGMRHAANTHLATDDGRMWRAIGEMRRRESDRNQQWKVKKFWLDEVARVLRYEVPRAKSRLRFGQSEQGADGSADVSGCQPDDYELLGLPMSPPPSEECVAAAFRAQAMRWHPDLASPSAEEACTERFRRIVKAHGKLRNLAKMRKGLVRSSAADA